MARSYSYRVDGDKMYWNDKVVASKVDGKWKFSMTPSAQMLELAGIKGDAKDVFYVGNEPKTVVAGKVAAADLGSSQYDYETAMDEATAKNEALEAEIRKGYQDWRGQAEAYMASLGQRGRSEIDRTYGDRYRQIQQNLTDRGFGSSTVGASMYGGIDRARLNARQSYDEMVAREALGQYGNIESQRLNFLNSIQARYPDLGQHLNTTEAYGASGGGSWSTGTQGSRGGLGWGINPNPNPANPNPANPLQKKGAPGSGSGGMGEESFGPEPGVSGGSSPYDPETQRGLAWAGRMKELYGNGSGSGNYYDPEEASRQAWYDQWRYGSPYGNASQGLTSF